MNGRVLMVLFMSLALLATCFISAPVLSGEHPWDSDRDGDDERDPDLGDPFYIWDTIEPPDTAIDNGVTTDTGNVPITWYDVVSSVFSTWAMMF